jgi:hypothetical protein
MRTFGQVESCIKYELVNHRLLVTYHFAKIVNGTLTWFTEKAIWSLMCIGHYCEELKQINDPAISSKLIESRGR